MHIRFTGTCENNEIHVNTSGLKFSGFKNESKIFLTGDGGDYSFTKCDSTK